MIIFLQPLSRLYPLLLKGIFLFALFSAQPMYLSAQSNQTEDKFFVGSERYHRKTGWVNSIGIHAGNIPQFFQSAIGLGENLSVQFDLNGYKMLKPKHGIGGGLSYKLVPTSEFGYEAYSSYEYAEIFLYSKHYGNFSRRRQYVDVKLGYSLALDTEIVDCYLCEDPNLLTTRLSSGPMIQPGFGVEFASKYRFRWGMKLSLFLNYVNEVRGKESSNTIPSNITVESTGTVLSGLLFGFNFYL